MLTVNRFVSQNLILCFWGLNLWPWTKKGYFSVFLQNKLFVVEFRDASGFRKSLAEHYNPFNLFDFWVFIFQIDLFQNIT